ncbi:hypothetical protein TWF173_002025 [Orbilia oligospora]|nr:hypothetical protein TWF173_002025 [Orbilia oligospora]
MASLAAALRRTACPPTNRHLFHRAALLAPSHVFPSIPSVSHTLIAHQPHASSSGKVSEFHTTTHNASSHAPMSFSDLSTRKKVTINTIRKMYEKGEKITMLTAHDFPSGLLADQAGIDVVLVGDSLAMVGLGMEVSFIVFSYEF